MALKIFNLRDVPEDEAEEVRELLNQHEVDYYETPPGNWGVSVHALWLKDEEDAPRVGQLLGDYQKLRYEDARREFEQLKSEGKSRTFISLIKDSPMKVMVYLICIVLVLYISVSPFILG